MPTNQWFQENPKVSAYIPKALHQRLEEWMEHKGVKKVSQAITQILEEHLGVTSSSPNQTNLEPSRLETLEGKWKASFN